jgi:GNAT superfamily N-acetyltransferase
MIVRPDRRRQGIGALLLEALETWAAQHGIARLWLCNDGPAVAFYERCGWVQTEIVALTTGVSVSVLTKEIAPRVTPS